MALSNDNKLQLGMWIVGGIATACFGLFVKFYIEKPKSSCQEREEIINKLNIKLVKFRNDLVQSDLEEKQELKLVADSLKTYAERKDQLKTYKELCLD